MVAYLIFRFFIALFSILPFRIIYWFSDILVFISMNIISYRKHVISKNIDIAFPGLTILDKKKLIKEAYRNLYDISLESLKSYSMTPEKIKARYSFENTEWLNNYFDEGKDIIAYSAHFGNWEWGPLIVPMYLKHLIIGLIKPIKNQRIYKYIFTQRNTTGAELVDIYGDKSIIYNKQSRPKMTVYIGDQNPSNKEKAIEVDFFDTKTLCLHGAESHAKRTNDIVINLQISRIKRGYYHLTPMLVSDKPNENAPGEITQIYMSQLQKAIEANPSAWLWTHKRWKHSHSYK